MPPCACARSRRASPLPVTRSGVAPRGDDGGSCGGRASVEPGEGQRGGSPCRGQLQAGGCLSGRRLQPVLGVSPARGRDLARGTRGTSALGVGSARPFARSKRCTWCISLVRRLLNAEEALRKVASPFPNPQLCSGHPSSACFFSLLRLCNVLRCDYLKQSSCVHVLPLPGRNGFRQNGAERAAKFPGARLSLVRVERRLPP